MDELWSELSATMRAARTNAGMSLRETERLSKRGRGNLSQVETGKARPNRPLVEWYDRTYHCDGLLLSLFFEARTGHSLAAAVGSSRADPVTGDAFEVTGTLLPQGALVPAGRQVEIGWSLANDGTIDWADRSLVRVGACAGPRLLTCSVTTPVPDCAAGSKVDARVVMGTPETDGTYVAYWQMAGADGSACFAGVPYFAVQLVVRR